MKVLVLGAGWRVTTDIVPSLLAAGVLAEDITILRKRRTTTPALAGISVVTTPEGLDPAEFNGSVIISCLPQLEVFETVTNLVQRFRPSTILIDTPISKNYKEMHGLSWAYDIGVFVLEDSILIPWAADVRVKSARLSVFKNSFYHYHGTALLASISGMRLLRLTPWPLTDWLPWVFIDSKLRLFIMWGEKIPSKSSGIVITRNGQILKGRELAPESPLTYLPEKQGFLPEKLGISGGDEHMGPLRNLDEWKRVGLAIGLHSLLRLDKQLFPTLDKQLEFERLAAWDEESWVLAKIARKLRSLTTRVIHN